MNIIDILIAKKKSFTGETESLVRRANEAMAAANTVAENAEEAASLLEAAQTANETAQAVAEDLETLQANITNAAEEIVDTKLNNLDMVSNVTIENNNATLYKSKRATVTKNNITTNYDVEKNYTALGQNEDGAMTQKAITNALNSQKTYLENKINNIPTGGGSGNVIGNFDDAAEGSLVIVDDAGHLTTSTITENDLIQAQIISGMYIPKNALGLEIDYDNKTVTRTQEATLLSAGADFDNYIMYGGRKRCIVADNGEIVAFYGDNNYVEDGSLGQVMVYQPKFYYLRVPLKITNETNRTIINKENIYISAVKQAGFTIHPIFLDENNNELNYILLSAYEGSTFDVSNNSYNTTDTQSVDFNNDKLSSIANSKPISGVSQNLSVENVEKLATNRGAGWHSLNLAAAAMEQLLMIIEFGSLNLQNSFYKGITELTDSSSNISCLTGATSSLGSTSGIAASTTGSNNQIYTEDGKSAISYRGEENPYGNIWKFLGDVKVIKRDGAQYLTYKNHLNETKMFASALTSISSWISYFGYDPLATWAFIPSQCTGANSAVPVGDYTYVRAQDSNDKVCVIGGKASAQNYAGPFYYGIDNNYDFSANSYGARLIYKPTYNSQIYLANIVKWNGGE